MDIGNLTKKVDLNEGEWIDDIPDMEGVRFKVRSTNFKPYKVATAGLARRSGKKLRTDAGIVDFSVISGKALAEHILLDWEGPTENGKPLKYDAKRALAILTADDSFGIGDAFRRAVEWAGDQVAERIRETATEAAGN
ncbi:hypothetical protein SKP52_02685 [Sphingopyxis fribergensis]|uniref:Uncharacterized protein n=1 Tax=Sphingopyxis fribergensis TaxID=1515612 RepID=A0A0A7PE05_9SPHN|nr:hypothetical protein [Sphingopyxis fribergensis]AJA07468.1 hypothetical protein SKP52_02685 [Sphingopyxis fribergensis]